MKNNITKEELKRQIMKDRLRLIFKERSKAVAKILTHLIKRQKNV